METTPIPLFCKINIKGTTESPCYFTISHRPQKIIKTKRELKSISQDQPISGTMHLLVRCINNNIYSHNNLLE